MDMTEAGMFNFKLAVNNWQDWGWYVSVVCFSWQSITDMTEAGMF